MNATYKQLKTYRLSKPTSQIAEAMVSFYETMLPSDEISRSYPLWIDSDEVEILTALVSAHSGIYHVKNTMPAAYNYLAAKDLLAREQFPAKVVGSHPAIDKHYTGIYIDRTYRPENESILRATDYWVHHFLMFLYHLNKEKVKQKKGAYHRDYCYVYRFLITQDIHATCIWLCEWTNELIDLISDENVSVEQITFCITKLADDIDYLNSAAGDLTPEAIDSFSREILNKTIFGSDSELYVKPEYIKLLEKITCSGAAITNKHLNELFRAPFMLYSNEINEHAELFIHEWALMQKTVYCLSRYVILLQSQKIARRKDIKTSVRALESSITSVLQHANNSFLSHSGKVIQSEMISIQNMLRNEVNKISTLTELHQYICDYEKVILEDR